MQTLEIIAYFAVLAVLTWLLLRWVFSH